MPLVLIIDDSSFQRQIMKTALAKEGYETIEASSGEDGLKLAQERNPDCILLDIIMPAMSGKEVLKSLKDSDNQAPVIMVTADIQETTRKECINLGAVGFVNKPVKGKSLETLFNILQERLKS